MADTLAAANAAFADFETKYPEAADYFCFLAGFNAAEKARDKATKDARPAIRSLVRAYSKLCDA